MIVRRIREHVATHNWFAVAIDLAIVVLGVFLGTQANNWNEARLDRVRADAYRVRLIADLRENERDMTYSAAYYRRVAAHAKAALDAFDRPQETLGEQFLVDASQASQVYLSNPRRVTYDAMIGAGDLTLLGAMGDRVVNYYVTLDGVVLQTRQYPPYRERLRREIPFAVEWRIREACGDVNLVHPDGNYKGTVLPETCAPGLDRQAIANGVARLRAPELDRDLSRYVLFLIRTVQILEGQGKRSRALRQALEREAR